MKRAPKRAPMFVVQKHLASHLHYDLRLEHNGVLLSWAIPKGPSLNPADKRFAVHVEDHPIDYGDFEGVIPSGYGAGVVMLWDRGTWQAENGDVDGALAQGELKFKLNGVKLKGSWVLVRMRRSLGSKEQWLLIKHRDKWSGEVDVTSEMSASVKSFGDFPDILAANDEPEDWTKSPPAKGGDAGKLYRSIIPAARKLRENPRKKPKATKSIWESHRNGKSKATSAAKTPNETTSASRKSTSSKTSRLLPTNAVQRIPISSLRFGSKVPKLTNATKVLFPKTGFTKGQLVDYYTRIAPMILPHTIGRAATFKRYPDGVEGKFFFEKRCASHRPEWVNTLSVERSDASESIDYCELRDVSTLAWAANLAAIELHVPLSLASEPDRPLMMVFDLDPGAPATIKECVDVAWRMKSFFDLLKLECVIKTSGGKGLHLLIPINNSSVTFTQTKQFARALANTFERDDPKRIISSMSRDARAGKVFIDWSQNDRNKTTACVFSVRARETPTVSWPVEWDELKQNVKSPTADKVKNEPRRFSHWVKTLSMKQLLPSISKLGEA